MRRRLLTIGALTTLLLVVAPLSATGQDMNMMDADRVDLEVRAGTAIPGDNLVDLTDVGPTLGATVGWQFHDRLAFVLDGQVDFLGDEERGVAFVSPAMDLYHYGGGFEIGLTDPVDSSPWTVSAIIGGGATTMDTEPVAEADDFTETYGHVNGGIEFAFQASEDVEVALAGRAFVMFTDEDETSTLTAGDPTADAFDTAVSYPVTLSLAWTPTFR